MLNFGVPHMFLNTVAFLFLIFLDDMSYISSSYIGAIVFYTERSLFLNTQAYFRYPPLRMFAPSRLFWDFRANRINVGCAANEHLNTISYVYVYIYIHVTFSFLMLFYVRSRVV